MNLLPYVSIYFKRGTILLCSLCLTIGVVKADCVYEQSVKGAEFGIGIMITWKTSMENNNSLFVVEKSSDGRTFSKIGTATGSGNSRKSKPYNFLDASATGYKNIYRLRQVDYDGSFTFSDVVTVYKKVQNQLMVVQLSSESVQKSFSMTLDALSEGDVKIIVKDASGAIVSEKQKHLINGLNDIAVDLAGQREGAYKVVIQRNAEEKTFTVRKVADEMERNVNVASDKKANPGRH